MHTAEPHRRQIICQLPADPRGLTITQQKRYCSRCPLFPQARGNRYLEESKAQSHRNRRPRWPYFYKDRVPLLRTFKTRLGSKNCMRQS
jgi:hypothetical protein